MLVVKSQRPTSKRLRVVYYLWSAEGPLRITDRLHRALVERSLALPQFAATKQKIIETIVQPLTRDSYALSARGLMYSFDPKGFIEETIKTEGVIHLPRFGSSEPKLVDLTPKIKARRVRERKLGRQRNPCWTSSGLMSILPVLEGRGYLCYVLVPHHRCVAAYQVRLDQLRP